MDLRLSAEQEQLVAAYAGLFAKRSSPEDVRAAEPGGFDPVLWDAVQELGIVAMAVEEAAGGWGATPLDLALVAEQQGWAMASAPCIEAQVAARLLARVGADPAAAIAGDRLVTVGLHPASTRLAPAVPAAAVADDALVLVDDELLLVPLAEARRPFENLASMPLADVDLDRVADRTTVVARGATAIAAHDAAVDDWLRLTAAALVGIGARALSLGVEYVGERRAWGVPIGSFQAISHRLADSATAVDGARLLAYEAAWAATDDVARAPELAAMAFAFAAEAARDVTYRSLHFHGGYGFMLEYDVQLLWRRARGWAGVYGEPAMAYRRAASRRYGKEY